MIDIVALRFLAGSGGMGRVSFFRSKYILKGGPDGGMGGNGGSILLRADNSQSTLKRYSGLKTITAESGANGGAKNCTGAAARDLVILVPVGTKIWQVSENAVAQRRRLSIGLEKKIANKLVENEQFSLEKEGAPIPAMTDDVAPVPENLTTTALSNLDLESSEHKLVATLAEHGQELILCQGGFGGRGNQLFKSSRETTPLRAEFGSPGEDRWIILEQELLADVGLIGVPNAGKSTLLSVLTQATPAIGAYPFTTLEPQLGMLVDSDREIQCVVADIPGLIAGASQGKGLGISFLRHVRHCRGLIFVLSIADESLTAPVSEQITALHEQFSTVRGELSAYDERLLKKSFAVCIAKTDIYSAELLEAVAKEQFAGNTPVLVSAATHTGLKELHDTCLQLLRGH
ncbi:MAG: GTPase ObgE [bacterium]|nr:GTPase ObgE [bacterium]